MVFRISPCDFVTRPDLTSIRTESEELGPIIAKRGIRFSGWRLLLPEKFPVAYLHHWHTSQNDHPIFKVDKFPYDLTTIQQIINDLTNICEFHLDIDMQDGIGPTIGLECSQGRFQSQGMIYNDINLMDYLVTNGWCSQVKRDEI